MDFQCCQLGTGAGIIAGRFLPAMFPPKKAAQQPEYTTSGGYEMKLRELA